MTRGDGPTGPDGPKDDRREFDRRDADHRDYDRDRYQEPRYNEDRERYRNPPMGRGRARDTGRGLGYSDRLGDRAADGPWERGSRGDVSFVRGEMEYDRRSDGGLREEATEAPMGRGRGRGRGVSNRPAWMDGPTGSAAPVGDEKEENKDDTMELLLAQARQVQQEQMKKQSCDIPKEQVEEKKRKDDKKEAEKKQREQQELEKKRLEQEKKEEEERIRLEMEKLEQEEQRQLLALVGDEMETDVSASKKRSADDEEEEDLFEFETEEEREERLAQQRREERRKKLKMVQVVDEPRNREGVIASEMEVDAVQENNQQQEEEKTRDPGTSDDDSFDIFATNNPTPIPQPKNGNPRNNATASIARSNIAQECDDAEGYYKANIGEIITVPKQRNGEEDEFARFRVFGIIGKGVFSTVIKVVEDTSDNNASGREIAMKIIRNNEVMARAAAKEMRILRMLCQPREKNDKSNDWEEDPVEKERRVRENHNIVRLLETDPEHKSFASPPPEYRSHCIFLFEFLPYNLREVLSKFGKNVGITLTAVRSYARQLLCALGHLERHGIVHGESFLARVPTIFQIWNPLVANEILSSHKFIYEYHVTNSLQRI